MADELVSRLKRFIGEEAFEKYTAEGKIHQKDHQADPEEKSEPIKTSQKSRVAKKEKKRLAREQLKSESFKRFGQLHDYLGLSPRLETEPVSSESSTGGPVVFISVDVEVFERNHQAITEIGVATLDTKDLTGPPGENGVEWIKMIKGRHFWISENRHLRNYEFLYGCPEHFCEKFGRTEIISINSAKQSVEECFKVQEERDGCLKQRPVILVGHNPNADIEYLRVIGLDIDKLPGVQDTYDTATLHRVWKGVPQPVGLGSLMCELDMYAHFLHNAGNDAAYTLCALVGLGIKSFESPKSKEEASQGSQAGAEAAVGGDSNQKDADN